MTAPIIDPHRASHAAAFGIVGAIPVLLFAFPAIWPSVGITFGAAVLESFVWHIGHRLDRR